MSFVDCDDERSGDVDRTFGQETRRLSVREARRERSRADIPATTQPSRQDLGRKCWPRREPIWPRIAAKNPLDPHHESHRKHGSCPGLVGAQRYRLNRALSWRLDTHGRYGSQPIQRNLTRSGLKIRVGAGEIARQVRSTPNNYRHVSRLTRRIYSHKQKFSLA